jgi:hypothetical protein
MDPTEGTLLFDGVPYQNIQLKHLRVSDTSKKAPTNPDLSKQPG